MKASAAMIPPRTSLGLSEPDGVLHVLGDGFWSLCGQWCKKIMPQRLAATWPWCPSCLLLESIKRAAEPAPPCKASLALERVVGAMVHDLALAKERMAIRANSTTG